MGEVRPRGEIARRGECAGIGEERAGSRNPCASKTTRGKGTDGRHLAARGAIPCRCKVRALSSYTGRGGGEGERKRGGTSERWEKNERGEMGGERDERENTHSRVGREKEI